MDARAADDRTFQNLAQMLALQESFDWKRYDFKLVDVRLARSPRQRNPNAA